MQAIQTRWKAVLAFVSILVSNLIAFYQANQNVTLKSAVAAVIASIIGSALVHQVPNKKG